MTEDTPMLQLEQDEESNDGKAKETTVGFSERLSQHSGSIRNVLLVVIALITSIVILLKFNGESKSVILKETPVASQQNTISSEGKVNVNICGTAMAAKTFPDIDYAFYGYNLLKGYPLAIGIDPGLTHPIFQYDYRERKLSGDCRYIIPKGLVVTPDVACVTSFTSKTVKDSSQLAKSLSVSAHASGGGWGVSFSASTQFKKSSSEMSSKETRYTFSSAKCDYYLSMLDEVNPPPLSNSFIEYTKKLKTLNDAYDFFNYYGTHFLQRVVFGARFVYENKISSEQYKTLQKSSFSLEMQASYSGLFSFSAGMGMSDDQQKAAENFQSNSETSTSSVGAPPPANGDTMTWAATVKDNPVPTKTKLVSIEDLFTAKYMRGTDVDYNSINKLIKRAKTKYCGELMKEREVHSCADVNIYTQFLGFTLGLGTYSKKQMVASQAQCASLCGESCVAVSYENHPPAGNNFLCFLYNGNTNHTAVSSKGATTILFMDNMIFTDSSLSIRNVEMVDGVQIWKSIVAKRQICVEKCKSLLNRCIGYALLEVRGKSVCSLYDSNSFKLNSVVYRKDSVLNIVTSFK